MADSLSVGSVVELTINDFAVGGESVGRVGNFVIFVPGGSPGDKIEAQITELKKSYGRARIHRILEPSVRRVQPRCPVYNECGGCHLQHVNYDSQLQFKTKMVQDAIEHIAGLDGVKVRPCRRMQHPWNYRCKAQVVVGAKPYLFRAADDEETDTEATAITTPSKQPTARAAAIERGAVMSLDGHVTAYSHKELQHALDGFSLFRLPTGTDEKEAFGNDGRVNDSLKTALSLGQVSPLRLTKYQAGFFYAVNRSEWVQ